MFLSVTSMRAVWAETLLESRVGLFFTVSRNHVLGEFLAKTYLESIGLDEVLQKLNHVFRRHRNYSRELEFEKKTTPEEVQPCIRMRATLENNAAAVFAQFASCTFCFGTKVIEFSIE